MPLLNNFTFDQLSELKNLINAWHRAGEQSLMEWIELQGVIYIFNIPALSSVTLENMAGMDMSCSFSLTSYATLI